MTSTISSSVIGKGATALSRALDLLADFTLDAWLMAKFAPRLGVKLDGRTWERSVAGLLYRPGFSRRQGPGSLRLFNLPSASGASHEIDGAASSRAGSIVLECKATSAGITKADVALFHFKVMDFYKRAVVTASREKWWCTMCGTSRTDPSARAAALSVGLFICDPDRLPLPVLLRAASRPSADMHVPDTLLQEIVRLGERALRPQQLQWPYHAHAGEIVSRPSEWTHSETADLMWLEDELSSSLLELYERRRPGVLQNRAENLI
ncbi:hypothetical protein, partial [Bradyrhizobium sp. P5_C11_2]